MTRVSEALRSALLSCRGAKRRGIPLLPRRRIRRMGERKGPRSTRDGSLIAARGMMSAADALRSRFLGYPVDGHRMTGYSTTEVAKILGLSPAQVRGYVRAGFLSPERGDDGRMRFSFPDLVFLRTARG